MIVSIPQKISEEKIVDVAGVNLQRCREESEQWLENIDPTHLVFSLFCYSITIVFYASKYPIQLSVNLSDLVKLSLVDK